MAQIDIYDDKTPLHELRDILGWETTPENAWRLVMVLCDRIEALERRIKRLENDQYRLQNDASCRANGMIPD